MTGIREVAQHLNLAISTVSRALNDRPGVSAETKQRVFEVAELLGYRPNQSGRSLRQGMTGHVAFLLPTTSDMLLEGTTFVAVLDGLRLFLAEHGLNLLVFLYGSEGDELSEVRNVVERRLADGVILSGTNQIDRRIEYLAKSGLPFVCFGRSQSGGEHAWVDFDVEAVARTAVERFSSRGHRRVAVAVPHPERNFGRLFEAAFQQLGHEAGLQIDEALLMHGRGGEEGGAELADRLLAMQDRPSGVILLDHKMAMGLYGRTRDSDLRPGRELAVVGFLETAASRYLEPRLTAFSVDLHGIGRQLGEALLAQMHSVQESSSRQLIQELWPMELVEGDSDPAYSGDIPSPER